MRPNNTSLLRLYSVRTCWTLALMIGLAVLGQGLAQAQTASGSAAIGVVLPEPANLCCD